MLRSTGSWVLLMAGLVLCGCHYNVELHRVTQERKLYDDLCARGSNVWRVFYQGTDSAYHRYMVNDRDRWRPIRIPKAQIALVETLPPTSQDTAYFGHYCVDPCNDWRRATPCWLRPSPRPTQ